MKLLDRTLAGEFLRAFACAFGALLALVAAVDVLEKLRWMARYEPSLGDAAAYFAARLPWMATQVLPMAGLFATVLSLALLSRAGEVTAWRSAGVPLWRLAVPYLVCAAGVCAAALGVQEGLAPPGFARARQIKQIRIKQRPRETLWKTRDVWLRFGDRIVHVDRLGAHPGELVGVTVAEVEGSRLRRRIDARLARWEGNRWVFRDGATRSFPEGQARFATETFATLPYPGPPPERFRVARLEAEELSWAELSERIRARREAGLDTRELRVGLWAKTSLPLAALLLPLLAIPVGLRVGARGGLAAAMLAAVALGAAYWLVTAAALAAGKAGALPPALAAWAGNGVFGLLGLWRLHRAER
ncbi:MAG: hypothetical protein Kow0092_36960 [Deferrisomatales bacterium]